MIMRLEMNTWWYGWLIAWLMGRLDPAIALVVIRRLGWRGCRYRCVYPSRGLGANYVEACYVKDLRQTIESNGLGTVRAIDVLRPWVRVDIGDVSATKPKIRDTIARFDIGAAAFSALDTSQTLAEVEDLVERFIADEPILALVDRLVYRQGSLRDGLMRLLARRTFDPDEVGTRRAVRLALRKITSVERRCLKLTHADAESPKRVELLRYADSDIEDDVCESQLPSALRPLRRN